MAKPLPTKVVPQTNPALTRPGVVTSMKTLLHHMEAHYAQGSIAALYNALSIVNELDP